MLVPFQIHSVKFIQLHIFTPESCQCFLMLTAGICPVQPQHCECRLFSATEGGSRPRWWHLRDENVSQLSSQSSFSVWDLHLNLLVSVLLLCLSFHHFCVFFSHHALRWNILTFWEIYGTAEPYNLHYLAVVYDLSGGYYRSCMIKAVEQIMPAQFLLYSKQHPSYQSIPSQIQPSRAVTLPYHWGKIKKMVL